MSDKLTKDPVTPSKEMLELLKDWVAPDVSEVKKASVVGKTNFMGMSIEEMYNKKQVVVDEEEEEVKPLTAEEIEQIRQDAYQEGFEQGKQEGIEAGHAEGLEKGHEEGLKAGHEEGFSAGQEEGKSQINEAIARWQSLTDQLYNPIERIDAAVEQQLLNLGVMLAESVLRTELKSNKDSLLAALHESVAALPFNTEFAEIHMHPDDLELIKQEYDDEALAEQKWILKSEPSYNLGDVIVATPNSLIDRTVKQRIEQTFDEFVQDASLNKELNSGPSVSGKSTSEPEPSEPAPSGSSTDNTDDEGTA